MTVVRPLGGRSAADPGAARACSWSIGGGQRRPTASWLASLALLASLGVASQAAALIITGGPVYTLPGGGNCTVSAVPSTGTGAIVTCSGVNLAAHTHVYFGIKNDTNVNGNTMTGVAPAAAGGEVFRYDSNTVSAIKYTSSTQINDLLNGGLQTVNNQLILTLNTGSATIFATGGTPGNNTRGDIQALFRIDSGSSFSIKVEAKASNTLHALGIANPAVYDPTHTPLSGSSDFVKVDLGFYFSDCGDGTVDSPEDCDLGGANGDADVCCNSDCTFRAMGEICRPGAGLPCDGSEACTGSASACPADDAIINSGNVCRPGSGDICDENELCTGIPGQTCPPDDAPGKAGTTCRMSSVGDVCDQSETCTGVAGSTCPPDDAPGKINVVCRPGSGDICDPDEKCSGLPGQGCPANVVANPTTVCRAGSGDVCDPSEHCTAIPGQACPANFFEPSSTVCRAAAGTCDVAEQCPGAPAQQCPTNSFVPATTSCNDDSNVCTIDECDGNGACAFVSNKDCNDGNSCTQDSCDAQDGCKYSGAPALTCLPASKALIKIKDSGSNTGDGVKFLWRGGPSLIPDMGDPTQTTRYELCIYDNRGVQMAMGVPPGNGWSSVGSPSSPKGFKYKDASASSEGIKLIKTKASSLAKASVKVIGKGDALPDTEDLPFQFPVTAQVYASDGMCWEATFDQTEIRKNGDNGFSAKQLGP